jgi:1,4-dihydroxy-2-naphthoate octaprenyltransferase
MVKEVDDLQNLTYYQRWKLAARPKTLWAAVSPVVVGVALASQAGNLRLFPALAALIISVLIQIGTNFVNDVVDYERGVDTEHRLGPPRVTQLGLLKPKEVWAGVGVTFGLAVFGGIYLAYVTGWPVFLIGATCILAGYFYTAGPFPLAYNGWGDVGTLIFFGFVAVGGTAYVSVGFLPTNIWLPALAVGGLVTNILVVNNIRDIQSDRKAGRKNIPVVFGRKTGEAEMNFFFGVAYLAPLLMWLLGQAPPWVLLTWVSIPLVISLMVFIHRTPGGRALNIALARMAQIVLIYSFLLAVGIIL